MSKKTRKIQHDKRLAKKRAFKAANKAHFLELKRLGQNKKSFRQLKSTRLGKKRSAESHLQGRCGNLGCKRCYPEYHRGKKVVLVVSPLDKYLKRIKNGN